MSPATLRRPAWRRALSAATTVATVGLLAFWFLALRPLSLGGTANYTVIHGNSMYPLYKDGDLIVTHTAADYTTGQVVAYRVPAGEVGAGHLVIHRIIGGSTATGLELQGDNNKSVDPWHPRLGDVAGTTWVQIPRAGRLLVLLHQPLVPALAVALVTMVVVLRRKPRRPPPTSDGGGHPSAGHGDGARHPDAPVHLPPRRGLIGPGRRAHGAGATPFVVLLGVTTLAAVALLHVIRHDDGSR